jgi:hypothetical protein
LRIGDLFLEAIFRLGIIEEFIELFIIFRFRIFISETAKRVIRIEEETSRVKLGRSRSRRGEFDIFNIVS